MYNPTENLPPAVFVDTWQFKPTPSLQHYTYIYLYFITFRYQKVTLPILNPSGTRYTRNKVWKVLPVNVIEALVILKGQNSALGFQNLPV